MKRNNFENDIEQIILDALEFNCSNEIKEEKAEYASKTASIEPKNVVPQQYANTPTVESSETEYSEGKNILPLIIIVTILVFAVGFAIFAYFERTKYSRNENNKSSDYEIITETSKEKSIITSTVTSTTTDVKTTSVKTTSVKTTTIAEAEIGHKVPLIPQTSIPMPLPHYFSC